MDLTKLLNMSAPPFQQLCLLFAALGSVCLLSACDDGNNEVADQPIFERVDNTFLHISKSDMYYGTRAIGSISTQSLIIENRGADQYVLDELSFEGDDPQAFAAQGFADTILLPAQSLRVDLSFVPQSQGRKAADFVIQYATIRQASDAVNLNEQRFYTARSLEADGRIDQAIDEYSAYIAADPVTTNKRLTALKLPVLQQSKTYGDGPDLALYLQALEEQANGDYETSLSSLDAFDVLHNDSYLADDAQYLKAYIQLMNLRSYDTALATLQQLRQQFPDSGYYDTASYAEAIAHQQIGNDETATEILENLRHRHLGADVLGIQLPKDNMVSRLWFKRASDALQAI